MPKPIRKIDVSTVVFCSTCGSRQFEVTNTVNVYDFSTQSPSKSTVDQNDAEDYLPEVRCHICGAKPLGAKLVQILQRVGVELSEKAIEELTPMQRKRKPAGEGNLPVVNVYSNGINKELTPGRVAASTVAVVGEDE